MPPHGPGMSGSNHSHSAEFPLDTWNLYAMLEPSTTSLNTTNPRDTIAIFKPHERRFLPEPRLISDADQEIIVVARFSSPVHIRKMVIIGGGAEDGGATHPNRVRCFVNMQDIDFSNANSFKSSQDFDLPVNARGTHELVTRVQAFTGVNSLVLYFPSNHGGGDVTTIQYIGLQGEHTHISREPVNAVYELLCTGADSGEIEGKVSKNGELHLH